MTVHDPLRLVRMLPVTIFWPTFIGGVVALLIGVLFWRGASRVVGPMRDLQRQVNGERVASTITARNLRWGAGGWIVIGAVLIVASLLGLDW